jgi:hypothetical protein
MEGSQMNGTKLGSSKILSIVVSLTCMLLSYATASASVTGQLLGTAAPPGVIDGVSMTAFGLDPQPTFDFVTGVASPLGGNVAFNDSLLHVTVGAGWASWSHDYTGDVYRKFDNQPLTLTLPANTLAFYLYIEPNDGTQPFSLTATGSGGGNFVLNDSIFWDSSAAGFFFKADGETLTSIQISTGGDQAYAIGEFGIAVPAPGALALLGVAGVMVPSRRRRRRC